MFMKQGTQSDEVAIVQRALNTGTAFIGSFGCHELLDKTPLVADIVEHYVLSHPAYAQKRDWFALAEQAVAALRELYQRIGEERLGD